MPCFNSSNDTFHEAPDSSFFQYRKRVPADIQKAAYGRCASIQLPSGVAGGTPVVVQATLNKEVGFSLRTKDPATAKNAPASPPPILNAYTRPSATGGVL